MSTLDLKRTKIDAEGATPQDNGDGVVGGDARDEALKLLDQVQAELDQLNDQQSDQVLQLEQEYNRKRRPVYTKRSEVLSKLPRFWQTTLGQHPALKDAMTDQDMEVLAHCTQVVVEDFEDIKSGFRISLTFEGCPHFQNSTLTKEFYYSEDASLRIVSDLPEWREGYEPAGEEEEPGSKRGRNEYLFLNWFKNSVEELPSGEHDEIANIIKEEIWPQPGKFYENDALAQVGEVYEGDEEEEEGEDEDGEAEVLDEGEEVGEGEEAVVQEGDEEMGVEGIEDVGEGEEQDA